MRIIAGRWRGRRLAAPAGQWVRPSAERLREALFSILTARLGSFESLSVADLFAGTGALGLEALSRGAAHVTFVEQDRHAMAVLGRNVAALGAGAQATLLQRPVESLAPARDGCDLLFLDPPYGLGLAEPALAHLERSGWVAAGGWVAVETEQKATISFPGFTSELVRDYGKGRVHLLRRVMA